MEVIMNCIKGILALVVIAIIAGVVVMFSGVINVAATNPHSPLVAMILSTTSDNSVRYHAKGISAPPLDDPKMIMDGFRHYREMCVGCHLAPGIESSEIRKGLMPRPPKLQKEVDEWKPAELFWFVKNGVKMTGMPAWGPTHSDQKIWAIVAFLEKLPHMTADQYKEMDKMAGPEGEDEDADHHHDGAADHLHDDGEADHHHDDEGDHQH
jgi:mono/diheme cytochrome c family protein